MFAECHGSDFHYDIAIDIVVIATYTSEKELKRNETRKKKTT